MELTVELLSQVEELVIYQSEDLKFFVMTSLLGHKHCELVVFPVLAAGDDAVLDSDLILRHFHPRLMFLTHTLQLLLLKDLDLLVV